MEPLTFNPWPKTPRLFRDMQITEKIDGTNAAIQILPVASNAPADPTERGAVASIIIAGERYFVAAQSRTRLVVPGDDNHGFAAWVRDNALGLVHHLGAGTHFGEWWGSGIRRGYDQTPGQRQFSLFHHDRYDQAVRNNAWSEGDDWVPGLRVVPKLYQGTFSEEAIAQALHKLENEGSVAAPGFARPEGIIVWHSAARQVFKVLLENDHQPKGEEVAA